jgi:hypothetical protein
MAILAFVGATELEATESTMAFFWLIISHRANHFEDQVRYFFLTVMNLVYNYSSNQDIGFCQGEYIIDTHANSIVTTMSWFFAENSFIDFVSQKIVCAENRSKYSTRDSESSSHFCMVFAPLYTRPKTSLFFTACSDVRKNIPPPNAIGLIPELYTNFQFLFEF